MIDTSRPHFVFRFSGISLQQLLPGTQFKLSLSLFEAWIFFINHIQSPFSSYNFTVRTAFFYGCPDFHLYSAFIY